MINDAQYELLFVDPKPEDPNIAFLVEFLDGKDWVTARELVAMIFGATGRHLTDREIRRLADGSRGQIGSGQRGYKLVRQMTQEEHNHCRNWMNSQAENMKRRVVEMDRVFYARLPVA